MRLEFLEGPMAGVKQDLKSDSTMGRDASNAIRVQDKPSSLVHCAFFLGEHRSFIKDLGSTNGTFVNGARVVHAELFDGDEVRVGENRLRVSLTRAVARALPRETIRAVLGAGDPEGGDALPGTDPGEEDEADDEEEDVELTRVRGGIVSTATYYLKRRIAVGGMGSIYEAEQLGAEGFSKTLVLKIIRPQYVRMPHFVSSFIGEAKLVANLVHQNIVQIYHLGRYERGYFIAMEYIDGVDLTQLLLRQQLMRRETPVDIASYIVSRVCRGLEYAHAKRGANGVPLNLVHRDVSPKNIMITNEGEVKIADFGVAKATLYMEEGEGEYLVGSPQYMSPEQAACKPVDARSDIFSLGLLYYELLTGEPAYPDEDEDATLRKAREARIGRHPSVLRPELPERVVEILLKALAADPDKRYQNGGQFGYDLEYEMYSRGYGPTIVTMANYVADLFPDQTFFAPPERKKSSSPGAKKG